MLNLSWWVKKSLKISKGVIGTRTFKDRQFNGQKKQDKEWYGLQNATQKTKELEPTNNCEWNQVFRKGKKFVL
jgi:hypothetical protein